MMGCGFASARMLEKIHNQLLDSVPDGVFTVDTDWRITFFNHAAEQITGVRRQEAIGQSNDGQRVAF